MTDEIRKLLDIFEYACMAVDWSMDDIDNTLEDKARARYALEEAIERLI